MVKTEELSNPLSCLNRAEPGEFVFTLLARDPAAPVAIRAWVAARINLRKNHPNDPQVHEAISAARKMEEAPCWHEDAGGFCGGKMKEHPPPARGKFNHAFVWREPVERRVQSEPDFVEFTEKGFASEPHPDADDAFEGSNERPTKVGHNG